MALILLLPLKVEKVNHPYERLLSKCMDLPIRAAEPAEKKFEMTIRDYLQNPLPAPMASRTAAPEKSTAQKESLAGDPEWCDTAKAGLQKASVQASRSIQEAVQWASEKYNVSKEMITAIMKTESAFNPKARSPAGAMGLMQLMPGTAKEMGVTNPFDIRQNVEGGVRYFRKMLDRFGQDKRLALAAYNAGPGAVEKHGGIPPYRETQNYVTKIMSRFQRTT